MSWSYLQLCNRVLARLNEVPLLQTNFTSAVGFQLSVQGFVNDALNDIYDAEDHWPFLWAHATDTITNYVQQYNLPATQTEIDWNSFFLKGNFTASPIWQPQKLKFCSYHDWLESLRADDERVLAQHTLGQGDLGGVPEFVVPQEDKVSYVLSGIPDTRSSAQFQIVYDYWYKPTDLVNATDLMVIPDQFSKVVLDGITYYAYMFRDNVEEAQAVQQKFTKGIEEMRRKLINKEDYMRSDQAVTISGYR